MTSRRFIRVIVAPAAAIAVAAIWYETNRNMALAALRAAKAPLKYPGRRALVVGGTSGIGRGLAIRLAEADYDVTIMGRDSVRGDEAVKACQKARGGAGAHEFVHVDAALLSNIRAAAATFSATHDRLDALVLTQSIASMDGRTETAEGIDKKLALHYFGRFEFTEALLPLLRRGPAPRVMSVLSAGVHSVYPNAVDDFELRTHYSLKNAADAAGLYNDAGLDGLAHEATNSRVAFIHAAPGFVNTAWGTDLPWYARYAVRMLQPLGRSAADCAEYLVGPILRPDTATGAVVLIGQDGQTVKAAHTAVHAPLLQMTREVNARALASAAAKASAATPAASAASK